MNELEDVGDLNLKIDKERKISEKYIQYDP